jgi:hypothetical protein
MVQRSIAGFIVMITLVLVGTGGPGILAQEASISPSGDGLAALGLPEFRVVVDDLRFDAPDRASAGRTLIVVENQGTPSGAAGVTDINFLKLPDGVSLQELNEGIGSEDGVLPDWYDDIVSTGGFKVPAGEIGFAVIDLQPGEWVVGAGDPNPFVPLTISGDSEVPSAEPRIDVEVDIVEFSLGLPDQLNSGNAIWHVMNSGTQPHEIMLVETPELLTVEQVVTILTLPEGEAPPPGIPHPDTLVFPPLGLQTMSAGQEIWVEMDLGPGFYVALCAVPDPESGAPHAALGEISVFSVSD